MSPANIIIERLLSGIFGQGLNPRIGDDPRQTAIGTGSFASGRPQETTDSEAGHTEATGIAPPLMASDQPLVFIGGLGGEMDFPGFSRDVAEWDSYGEDVDLGGENQGTSPSEGAYKAEVSEGGEVVDDSSADEFANPDGLGGKSMKPGGGGRFAKLKSKLAARGARNPGALAAYIGRKKYGAAKMAKWSAAGRSGGEE